MWKAALILTWRPLQGAPADDVNVEVWHGLSTIIPGVEHGAEPAFCKSLGPGNIAHLQHEVCQQCCIFFRGRGNAGNRFAGDKQHMHWCSRGYIAEGYAEFIFIDDGSRNFLIRYFLKKCFFHVAVFLAQLRRRSKKFAGTHG